MPTAHLVRTDELLANGKYFIVGGLRENSGEGSMITTNSAVGCDPMPCTPSTVESQSVPVQLIVESVHSYSTAAVSSILNGVPQSLSTESLTRTQNVTRKRRLYTDETASDFHDNPPMTKVKPGPKKFGQREIEAMEKLAAYLEDRVGDRKQSRLFTCKVHQRPNGRYETIFYNAENKRFRSMADVARSLDLTVVTVRLRNDKLVHGSTSITGGVRKEQKVNSNIMAKVKSGARDDCDKVKSNASRDLPSGICHRKDNGKYEVKVHFAGSPRYIGTFVSRSDAINASEMGRRYFDTIPYNNLSPQQIEEIVISMRRVHMPQFQIARSPSRITNNAEEVKLNSSKAVTRPPDRHTSKDTRRDTKETTRKRNFDALGAKDLPRGIRCRPSGRFQVNVDFARSRCYIGTFVSRSDAINASEMGRKYFDNIPYDNLSPQQIEEIVISMRKCARNYYDNLKDNNPSPDQLEGHFITMREAALELVKESTRSLVQQVLDDMILIVRENVGDETSSELERSRTKEVMEATSERVRSSARYLVPPPLNHQPLSMTQEEMEMRRERARSAAGYVLPGANAHQIGPLSTDPPSVNNASTMAIQRAQVAAVPEPRVTYPLEETTTTVAPSQNISKTVAERLFSVHRFLVSEAGTIGLNLKLLHSSKKCIISTVHSNSIAVDHGIEEGDEILPSHDNEDVYSHIISASKQRPLLFEVKRLYRHPGRLIARSSGAPVPHSLHRFIITTSGPLGVTIEKVDSLILLRNIAAMSVADIHGLQNDDILCIPYKNGQLQQIASLFVDAVKGGIRPLIIEVWRAVPLIVPSSATLSVLPTIKPTIGEENVSNGVSKGTTTTEADSTHAALQKDIAEEENNCIDDEDEATLPVSQMSQSLAPNSSNVFAPHAADHALHMQQLAAVEEKQATKYEYGNRYSEQKVATKNSDGTVEPATDPKILPDGTCQNGCWYPVLNGRMKCTGITNRRDADNGTLTPSKE